MKATGSTKRLDVQGLRAIAVILVIMDHLPGIGRMPGGFVGVDVFFVISGFVITSMMQKSLNARSTIRGYYFPFIVRRVIRLVPAMSVMIALTLGLSLIFAPPVEVWGIIKAGAWSEIFGSNFFFLSNFQSYWNPELLRNPLLHTWSLGVEFQTYLLFPLIMFGLFVAKRKAKTFAKWAVLAVSILSLCSVALFCYLLVFRAYPLFGLDPSGIAFYTPMTRFWEFGIGMLVVLLKSPRGVSRPVRTFLALAGIGLFVSGLVLSNLIGHLSLAVILSCLGTAFLIWAGSGGQQGIVSQGLAWKPLIWIGDRSYSIYLWHWPLLILAIWIMPGIPWAPLVAVGLAVLLAMASFRFLEAQITFKSASGVLKNLVPTVAILTCSVIVIFGAGISAQSKWFLGNNNPRPLAMPFEEVAVSGDAVTRVLNDCAFKEVEIYCTFFDSSTTPTIAVIGDSLAWRSFPAVALAAKESGLNAIEIWAGGCTIQLNSCPEMIYQYLSSHEIAGIIVNTNFDKPSNRQHGDERTSGRSMECSPLEDIESCAAHRESVEQFAAAAENGLAQLQAYSPNVLVALPFPQQENVISTCLNPPLFKRWFKIASGTEPCGATSISWQNSRQGLFPQMIRDVTKDFDGVTVWNPQDFLCSEEMCPAVINEGEQIMGDAIHWTWEASRFLYPEFSSWIKQLPHSQPQ
ncbi:MAG: acyltransferase [Aurantimicrobium sp.]|nr:acyltransferase [Aurantimicrobium sp.]